MSEKSSIFVLQNKNNNTIMKKVNYSRIFIQNLREREVFGPFCEVASDELLTLLFSKRDMWFAVSRCSLMSVQNMIKEVALWYRKDTRSDIAYSILMALKGTNIVSETVD